MRYLLSRNLKNELVARKNFIYEVFHLWMIPYNCDSKFIHLVSIPESHTDLCFIIGHNYEVERLLEEETIPEEIVVIITCNKGLHLDKMCLTKRLYLVHQDLDDFVYRYSGHEYGFDFNLTKSEIILYNCPKNLPIEEKINNGFTRIERGN